MSGIHIDEFYADAAQIIVSLYGVFPRPVTIFVEDICGPDEPDEYGVHSHRHLACFATLLWLAEEGYIRYNDTIRQEAIDQAVLTGRCFTALLTPAPGIEGQEPAELPPSIKAEHATVIYQLRQALKSKSSLAVQDAFSPLLYRMAQG
ncbi:MAG: hypothetical protein ACFHXK_11845 [bacterium]